MPALATITVVVPVHKPGGQLAMIREDVARQPGTELVVVLNGEAAGSELSPRPGETIASSARQGRGYAMIEGARRARGDIILFLHSDTVLPEGWSQEIRDVLADGRVVGGAFSLSFDSDLPGTRAMVLLSDAWRRLTGHLWGDRAMFVRSCVLQECIGSMEVPIFEDVRLSQQMNRRGKVVVSRKKVVTGWDAFRRNGALGHLWLIVKCHYWYIIGWEPERIFERYYR